MLTRGLRIGWRPWARVGLAVGLAVATAMCTDSPTAPTTVTGPTLASGAFDLACPLSIERITQTQSPLSVSFDDPVEASTQARIDKVECTPASGSTFPIGETGVRCTSRPADRDVASCAFSVRIISRRLRVTQFLAFGDSITVGFSPHASSSPPNTLLGLHTRSALGGGVDSLNHRPSDLVLAYPFKLNTMLSERYPGQDIAVVNAGFGGETTDKGRGRLNSILGGLSPEVLLLLEGSNDVQVFSPSDTLSNLSGMVRGAQGRGISVLLANLPPISSPRLATEQTRGREINGRIAGLAGSLGVPLVDVLRRLNATQGSMSVDGKHPTALGYTTIAETFFEQIVERFEVVLGVD